MSSPERAIAPVAHERTIEVELSIAAEDPDLAVLVGGADDAVRRERLRGPAPEAPVARGVETGAVSGGRERAKLVGAGDDALEPGHGRAAVALAPVVRVGGDGLDVARAQGAAAVDEPPLDDSAVSKQAPAARVLPDERVDAAERVLPVVLVEVGAEGLLQERERSVERARRQLVGVGELERGGEVGWRDGDRLTLSARALSVRAFYRYALTVWTVQNGCQGYLMTDSQMYEVCRCDKLRLRAAARPFDRTPEEAQR